MKAPHHRNFFHKVWLGIGMLFPTAKITITHFRNRLNAFQEITKWNETPLTVRNKTCAVSRYFEVCHYIIAAKWGTIFLTTYLLHISFLFVILLLLTTLLIVAYTKHRHQLLFFSHFRWCKKLPYISACLYYIYAVGSMKTKSKFSNPTANTFTLPW